MIWKGASEQDIINQGTLTFVKWDHRVWAITNAHVVQAYRQAESDVLSVALRSWQAIPGKLRFLGGDACRKAPVDLAIFEWYDVDALARAGKVPVDLGDEFDSPNVGEVVLVVGYPGSLREQVDSMTAAHQLAHVFATVRSVMSDNVLVRDEHDTLDREARFGGISGGPVFRVREEAYSLACITYEGMAPGDAQGSVYGENMVISASIPFSGELLDSYISMGCH
jgi:hypothetical protein